MSKLWCRMSSSTYLLILLWISCSNILKAAPEPFPPKEKREVSFGHRTSITSRYDSMEYSKFLNLDELCSKNKTGSLPNVTSSTLPEIIDSCQHVKRQDQYLMQLTPTSPPFPVYCVLHHQMTGDGWLVIQQRLDGSENFFRNWVEYREGFGDLNREFWLGLEHIHQITNLARHELLVEIADFGHHYFGWARYSKFVIGDESQKFILQELGSYSGTIGDSLTPNVGKKFSTYDNDNERSGNENCAARYKGAWWYDHCYVRGANLNGPYMKTGSHWSIIWWSFSHKTSLGYTRMLLRRLVQN